MPIVIAGDDPGSFGYNELTVDYYLSFMAWDLNLFDLKEIANNSIKYSLASNAVKSIGYLKFSKVWTEFIDSTSKLVCNNLNINLTEMKATHVYPSYGPNDIMTIITLYGYGFENTLCEKIYCYFNNVKTDGYLRKINEIICKTPLGFSNGESVNISIEFETVVFQTGLKYTFVSSNLIEIKYDSPYFIFEANNNHCLHFFFVLVLFFILFLFCRFFSINISISVKK